MHGRGGKQVGKQCMFKQQSVNNSAAGKAGSKAATKGQFDAGSAGTAVSRAPTAKQHYLIY